LIDAKMILVHTIDSVVNAFIVKMCAVVFVSLRKHSRTLNRDKEEE